MERLIGIVAAVTVGLAIGVAAQVSRPGSFVPGIPSVVKTPVVLVKAIPVPGVPLASTDLV